jgi:hypothetical protein
MTATPRITYTNYKFSQIDGFGLGRVSSVVRVKNGDSEHLNLCFADGSPCLTTDGPAMFEKARRLYGVRAAR